MSPSLLRALLTGLGGLMVLAGLLWAAQGAGIVTWPAGSLMLAQGRWVWIGLAMAILGLGVVAMAQRR